MRDFDLLTSEHRRPESAGLLAGTCARAVGSFASAREVLRHYREIWGTGRVGRVGGGMVMAC